MYPKWRPYSTQFIAYIFVLEIYVMVNWYLSKQGIRWPVSREDTAGSSLEVKEASCIVNWPLTEIYIILFIFTGVSVCPTREIQATAGVVTSPNHPSNYPADEDCTLTIDARQNVLFKIQFEALSIEEDDDGKFVVERNFQYCPCTMRL